MVWISGDYKFFELVTSGCAPTGTDPTTAAINAVTADGKTLTYDQFGFIDATDDSLSFHLSCDIIVGTFPGCTPTGRRRRNADGALIKFEIGEFHKKSRLKIHFKNNRIKILIFFFRRDSG